ncbi:MAG: lysoplasmalogenase family protein, partial [Aeromicrobium sp.]
MRTAKSPWLIAFAVITAVHLILNGAELSPWDSITKVMVIPMLVAWVYTEGGPRILVTALVFCTLGDLFLIWENTFTIGMAAFAIGHVCFIRFFISRGALAQLRRKPWIPVFYVAAAVALVVYIWTGLEADIKPLIPVYAALLAGNASTSLACDKRAGLGGALF